MSSLLSVVIVALKVVLALGILAAIYHHVAYPVLVAALARFRARHRQPNQRPRVTQRVTLGIAAYNEATVLADKIRNSLAIDWPDLEIIVATDGSNDDSPTRLEPFADRIVHLHEAGRAGKAAAMNRIAARATGEIIVFSDANAMYRPDAIRALIMAFTSPKVGAVSGAKRVLPRTAPGEAAGDAGFGRSEGLYWRYETWIRNAESRLGTTVATVGEILAIRRDLFRPIPPGTVNDDAWMTLDLLRRGFDVRFAPNAVSEELASLHEADERQRRRRITVGRLRLLSSLALWPVRRPFVLAALISHKVLRMLMPFVLAAILVASVGLVLLGAAGPLVAGLLLAQAVFYGASAIGRTAGGRRGLLNRTARLCHFLVASNISILAGFLDWMRGGDSVLWRKARR